MDKIQVIILESNLDKNYPLFLAKLTQRGSSLVTAEDVTDLYVDTVHKPISKKFLEIPHTTLRRMNYMTVAIFGLSTKCVSQLRTHAKRLSFMSTSTQYSSYPEHDKFFVQLDGITEAYKTVHNVYAELLKEGIDKDDASYVLPQGLRKVLIVSGNLDDWQYVIRTRLCHRNSKETQYVMRLLLEELRYRYGDNIIVNMLPPCVDGECEEGDKCCGRRFEL